MVNTPLPSLFGRFTAILSDHEDVIATLAALEQICVALDDGSRAPPAENALVPLLERLRADLAKHFHAEEGEAYFGVIERDRPGMQLRIVRLKDEHSVMLEAVRALHDLASAARLAELSAPARQFIARLRAHEVAEKLLLQEFFLGEEVVTDR